jgi:hypothetical protein
VGERVDVWTLRVMSIAVEALPADVPDHRPLSDLSPTVAVPGNRTAASTLLLAEGRRSVDGDVGPGGGKDDVAVDGDSRYQYV